MKKFIALLILLALVLTPLSSSSLFKNTKIQVYPSDKTASPGQEYYLVVRITPGTKVSGLQFDLSFDPTAIQVTSVVEGKFLKSRKAETYFMPGEIDNIAGTLKNVVGVVLGEGEYVSAGNKFVLIYCTASEQGRTGDLLLSNVVVGNKDGTSLPVKIIDYSPTTFQRTVFGWR